MTYIIDSHSITHHSFAHDLQLQMSAPHDKISELLHSMQSCISDVKAWATVNMLKLNDNKTELMLVTSKRTKHLHIPSTPITIGNAQITFKQSVKNLGFTLDCHCTMNAHVSNIAWTCYLEQRCLASIHRFLTSTTTATLVSASVLSRIDYCNSLLFGSTHDVSNYFTFTLFADDTTIVSAHHDIDILFSQANIELTKLYNWFCLNKLSLNIDKTSYILFSNKQDDPKNTINIDNINIKRVFSNKFLGVTIDHKLSWKTQIADVCKKVSICTGILNKVKSILSTKILNSLYSSLVEPHFTYCVEVWGNTYRSYLQSLYRKQKRAIRIVCKSSYLCHSADLFKKLEVLSLFHLVKYKTAIFMYKVFYGLVPANILSHFTHISNIYSTRQYKNLYVYYARTKHKQMCVEHMGVSIWNSIEIETINCMNLKLFKVKYKKSLLTQI